MPNLEEILGADGAVIAAYIVGVVIVCSVIALGVMQIASKVLALSDARSRSLRVAGALISILGIVLLAQLIRNV